MNILVSIKVIGISGDNASEGIILQRLRWESVRGSIYFYGIRNLPISIPDVNHGAGIFTYKTGWFLGPLLVHIHKYSMHGAPGYDYEWSLFKNRTLILQNVYSTVLPSKNCNFDGECQPFLDHFPGETHGFCTNLCQLTLGQTGVAVAGLFASTDIHRIPAGCARFWARKPRFGVSSMARCYRCLTARCIGMSIQWLWGS